MLVEGTSANIYRIIHISLHINSLLFVPILQYNKYNTSFPSGPRHKETYYIHGGRNNYHGIYKRKTQGSALISFVFLTFVHMVRFYFSHSNIKKCSIQAKFIIWNPEIDSMFSLSKFWLSDQSTHLLVWHAMSFIIRIVYEHTEMFHLSIIFPSHHIPSKYFYITISVLIHTPQSLSKMSQFKMCPYMKF